MYSNSLACVGLVWSSTLVGRNPQAGPSYPITIAQGARSLPKLEHSKAKPVINVVIDHLELLGGAQ